MIVSQKDNSIQNDEELFFEEDEKKNYEKIQQTFEEKKKILDTKKNIQKIKEPNTQYKKNFYIESEEIKNLTDKEVDKLMKTMGITVRGNSLIRPIYSWYQCGLSNKICKELTEKLNFKQPFPIQCQGIPILMSGRDLIAIAETGSGKTLAYLLPILKHIKSRKILDKIHGPKGLIIVPTRELATQVFSNAKLFGSLLGIKVVALYGGVDLKEQFSNIKKGSDLIICTPGRMIDILSNSKGTMVNLTQISFVVIDEGDRMFDMGFENQIEKIIQSTPRSRQTVITSATLPKNIESLARRILNNPLEVVIGNRGQICRNVKQIIQLVEDDQKLIKVLQLLGKYLELGKVLIFVDKKVQADDLYTNLVKYNYQPLLMHGDLDQEDRNETLKIFKQQKKVLIATSLMARGLDIPDIGLVINYNCPTFKEDYVHRIGRTGRAGKQGVAVTFITKEDDQYVKELIEVLEISNQDIPDWLNDLYLKFREKVRRGEAKVIKNKNFQGRGYKFDAEEQIQLKLIKKLLSQSYGFQLSKEDEEEIDQIQKDQNIKIMEKQNLRLFQDPKIREAIKREALKAASDAIKSGANNDEVLRRAQMAIRNFIMHYNPGMNFKQKDDNFQSQDLKNELVKKNFETDQYQAEFIINDYPETTRKKVTNKKLLDQISDLTETILETRGIYVKNNAKKMYQQKKLHIFIAGQNQINVMSAFSELKRICEQDALRSIN